MRWGRVRTASPFADDSLESANFTTRGRLTTDKQLKGRAHNTKIKNFTAALCHGALKTFLSEGNR